MNKNKEHFMWQELSQATLPEAQPQSQPLCLHSSVCKSALERFGEQLSVENKTVSLRALLIGSGHRKLNPPDVDLLVLSAENISDTLRYIEQYKAFLNGLFDLTQDEYVTVYDRLPFNSITRVIAALCRDGTTIEKAYERNNRSLITLRFWERIDMDINLQSNTLNAHAEKSDFSINTLYFDIKTGAYVYAHEYAIEDIRTKTLRAACHDPHLLLKNDITIFFRAIRIISTEDYTAEETLLPAMKDLPQTLPTAINEMNPDRLTSDKMTLFCSGNAVKALNFLEDHQLFYYLFPVDFIENHQAKEKILFLFRKIAEASDAIYNGDTQSTSYPHALARYFESAQHNLLDEIKKQKLILCLFDYAIHNAELMNQTLTPNKYSIYKHKNGWGFHEMGYHIAHLEKIGREIISLHLNTYSEMLKEKYAAKESPSRRPSPSVDSDYENSADNTSHESLSESSEPRSNMHDSDSEEETRTKISPTIPSQEKEEQPKHEHQEIVTTPENIKIEKKNKKKRGSNKNKNKNKPPPLTQEEKRIYDMYSHGADYLAIHEHENALYCLTQAAENETCKQELKLKIDNIMSTTKVENPETPSKIFLSIAVLFDSIEEHDEAVKYYQQFLLKQAIKNVGLDKDEPKESLYHFSFVYLRLMILFKELSRNTKKKEYYQMISEKYRNEIILSPIISKSIKNQEEEYTEKLSEEPPCNPIKRTSKENRAPVTIPGPNEWLEEANRSFDRGLYYSSKSFYYKTLKRVTDLNSTLFLIKQIMICYIQLEMYEQSIFFLEKEERKYDFIVKENNAQIIDRISFALSVQSWKSENIDTFCNAITLLEKIMHLTGNSDKVTEFFKENLNIVSTPQFNLAPHTEEKKSLLCFKIAASYSDILLMLIKKDRANTQISVLFLEMTSHYNRYQNGPKMAVIPTEEENKVSQRISNIQFILNLPQKIPTTSTFFQPNDASIPTATGIPSQIKT